MKRIVAVLAISAGVCFAANATTIDKEEYIKTAQETIKKVKRGKVKEKDLDKLVANQNKLIRLAIEGALSFAEDSPKDRKMMHLTVLNSERMKNLSLDQIEKDWHGGDYMRTHGIEINDISHVSDAMNLYDAIIHPATALIALEQYRKDGDAGHLVQVEDELTEVVMHVGQIGGKEEH